MDNWRGVTTACPRGVPLREPEAEPGASTDRPWL